jgi:alpha-amylase/alpha-mannosidase (GH57 family)
VEPALTGRRYVCVHGHFYQPPRENPWLERVEHQESAWPKHDWNQRVTDECYAPNAHARILGGGGRIAAIRNNYARISFNVGPTLLGWLEHARPDVYAAILAADRESAARFGGHGSAMAQVYNHMILPLASERDRITQVRWGLRDFERRFGRAPEGMWLAETAVDVASLEVLADHGIRFTVLAPHQCARVRRPGGSWEDVRGQRVDPKRPYEMQLPSGKRIALFFYDGPISRAVAFERLLDDGNRLADRLLGAFDGRSEAQLVHIATDGETYGHHHAYGEMALAAALARIEREPGVKLTTYGQLLEEHPPTWEAEIVPQTSWSCAHGIERWRADCGCNSGTGWSQRWRAPLREALDWLRDELAVLYEREAAPLLSDPWAARDAYGDVVIDRSSARVAELFEAHAAGGLHKDQRQRALELLELQRHAMLMYTSCGWFFDEISGIEAVQVLCYAARAMQLAEALTSVALEAGFRERLAKAPSNKPEYGDGEAVYERLVAPAKVDLSKIGACFALQSVWGESVWGDARERPTMGGFEGEIVDDDVHRTGSSRMALGRVRVRSKITTEEADFAYAVLHLGDHNILGGIRAYTTPAGHAAASSALSQAFSRADLTEVVRKIERLYDGATFTLRTLFYDEQAEILARLLADRTRAVEEMYETIYDRNAPLMRFLQSLEQPAPPAFKTAAEFTLMARLRRELLSGSDGALDRVMDLLDEARDTSVAIDPLALGMALQSTLEAELAALEADPDQSRLDRLARLAAFVKESAWKMDLGVAQNAAWKLAHALLPAWKVEGATESRRLLRAVVNDLGVDLDPAL